MDADQRQINDELTSLRAEAASLREQLSAAEKLVTLGTLAGGVAHDFNNILGSILGYADIMGSHFREDPEVTLRLNHIRTASLRAKELVHQILKFSREVEPAMGVIKLRKVIREGAELLRVTLPANLEFNVDLGPSSITVVGEETEIHQLVVNLCTNAVHSMEEVRGTLEVRLEIVSADAAFLRLHPNLVEGRYARLSVSDNGHGMSEQTMDHMFEPFFTTKEEGKGTGLGLAMIHRIVVHHRGDITVYSEPGVGTTFRVYLPLVEAESPEDEEESEPAVVEGSEHILLVDDEEDLAFVGKLMLEHIGYTVEMCTSSSEALEKFRKSPERFDVIITDMSMPGMTGAQLAVEVHRTVPHMRMILTSGFSESVSHLNFRDFGFSAYVEKPFITEDLGVAIRGAMEEETPVDVE